ncbi:DUF302 domain-containing protein [Thiohalocapsa marina]|uniref:DUF302 domain-containing protein n=1 Tax=Thiohalocapsa marina TaxID=424902 RepID=A0A5M8FA60_9GAMM|nr:DUF302 domain-containing protein [Thiohalocapsa marina]KAA6181627.1 DUF302 domain-containing protein [Thiohalocapsa marina]
MIKQSHLRAGVLLGALGLGSLPAWAGDYAVYESDSSFEDVMDALKLSIQERGMYINNIMHMDEMLERTGKDLGLGDAIYGSAQSVEFCSAVLSRRMTAENPARIVNCPFIVSVYTLPDQPDTTYVAYRTISDSETQGSQVMQEVAAMLEGVAEGAVSW